MVVDDIKRLTKDWLVKAEGDLRVAKQISQASNPVNSSVVYHAEQCVEKCIKAVITEEGNKAPRTHELVELIDMIKKPEDLANFRPILQQWDERGYAVEVRYPTGTASSTDTREALEVAENFMQKTCNILGTKK